MAQQDENVRIVIEAVGATEASRELAGVSKAMGGLAKPAAGVAAALKPIGPSLTGIAKAAGGLALKAATVGLAGIAAGLTGIVAAGLKTNNTFQQIEARLNAFNKDAGVTAQQIELIRVEAAKTPFAVEEMGSAFAALQGPAKQAGIEIMSLVQTAEILAASNPLEGLEGASFALREAMTGDFTSIIERFNLSRSTLNRLKDEGVPALEAISIAMKEQGLDMDLVSAQAETFDGRMSTLIDSFNTFAAAATKPIFDTVSAGLGAFGDELTAAQPQIDAFAALIATDLQNAINWLTGTEGLPAVETVLDTLETAWINARDAVTTFVQALSGDWQDRADKIDPLDRVMGNLALVIGDVTDALAAVFAALSGGETPTENATTGLTSLADVLAVVHTTIDDLNTQINDFNTTMAPVADLINGVHVELQSLADAIRSEAIVTWNAWSDAIETAVGWIQDAIEAFKSLGRVIVPLPAAPTGGGSGPFSAPAVPMAGPQLSTLAAPSATAFSAIGGGGRLRLRAPAAPVTLTIAVDARGAEDPYAVEQAADRGVTAALNSASRRSVGNFRLALDQLGMQGE